MSDSSLGSITSYGNWTGPIIISVQQEDIEANDIDLDGERQTVTTVAILTIDEVKQYLIGFFLERKEVTWSRKRLIFFSYV